MPQHYTAQKTISCDGGSDLKSKHPKVFINLEDGNKYCPYCGKAFVYQQQDTRNKKNNPNVRKKQKKLILLFMYLSTSFL